MSGASTVASSAVANAQAAGLDPKRLPRHVAIIMDGNGRWAKGRGWDRTRGHRQGADMVRAITTESVKLGIKRLTLYAFSTENWSRPALEVSFLMGLLDDFVKGELSTLLANGVRLEAIGQIDKLPEKVRRTLDATIAATAGNRNMVLCLALSYGGRDELVDACRAIAEQIAAGTMKPKDVTKNTIAANLYAPAGGDVDVVIRTAGEMRLSNFLPWQAIYAEYVSAPQLWPDFTVAHYHAALLEFQGRDRRYGGV